MTGLTIEDYEMLSTGDADHHRRRDNLVQMLGFHVKQHKLGEILCAQEFDFDGGALTPDISFVTVAKLRLLVEGRGRQLCIPDLVIEIDSQDDTFTNLMKKANRYRNVWDQRGLAYVAGWPQHFHLDRPTPCNSR